MGDVLMTILLSELVLPTLGFVIAAFVAWVSAAFKRWLGIEIEARHRDAFQTSLQNAARLLVMRHGPVLPGQSIPSAVLREGLEYVKGGAPDAIRHFRVSEPSIVERLIPHLLGAAVGAVVNR